MRNVVNFHKWTVTFECLCWMLLHFYGLTDKTNRYLIERAGRFESWLQAKTLICSLFLNISRQETRKQDGTVLSQWQMLTQQVGRIDMCRRLSWAFVIYCQIYLFLRRRRGGGHMQGGSICCRWRRGGGRGAGWRTLLHYNIAFRNVFCLISRVLSQSLPSFFFCCFLSDILFSSCPSGAAESEESESESEQRSSTPSRGRPGKSFSAVI